MWLRRSDWSGGQSFKLRRLMREDEMAIEFRCHQCNALLRVSDEQGGRQANRPTCSTVLDIPQPDSTNDFNAAQEIAFSSPEPTDDASFGTSIATRLPRILRHRRRDSPANQEPQVMSFRQRFILATCWKVRSASAAINSGPAAFWGWFWRDSNLAHRFFSRCLRSYSTRFLMPPSAVCY